MDESVGGSVINGDQFAMNFLSHLHSASIRTEAEDLKIGTHQNGASTSLAALLIFAIRRHDDVQERLSIKLTFVRWVEIKSVSAIEGVHLLVVLAHLYDNI